MNVKKDLLRIYLMTDAVWSLFYTAGYLYWQQKDKSSSQ
jgi:hypothetical protein